MAARTIRSRDEIEVRGIGREQSGADGTQTRIGYGAGRQPRVLVGVVRVWVVQVGAVNYARVSIFEEGRIDGCRVAVELHADAEAVGENGCNLGTLGREPRFALHH